MSIKRFITNSAFFAFSLSLALFGCKSEEEKVTPVKAEPRPLTRIPKEECIEGPIVTAPDGGEAFLVGNTIDIKWHVSCVDTFTSVKIELLVNNLGSDVLHTTVASATPHDGSFLWTIPTNFATNSTYKVKISAIGATNWDASNSYFTITDNVNNWLTGPNGGQSFTNNSTITVTWNKWLVPTTQNDIKLELYKGTALIYSLASSLANDGTEQVFIPTFIGPGTDYSVRITNTATGSTNYSDYSNSYFTITNFTNTSSWLKSPNGGESIANKSNFTILWDAQLVKSRFVNIELIKRVGGNVKMLASNVQNSGSLNWYVNETFGFSTFEEEYTIRITDADNFNIRDQCNNWFRIRR